jgi:hypothetical protein
MTADQMTPDQLAEYEELSDEGKAVYDEHLAKGADHADALCVADVRVESRGRTYVMLTAQLICEREIEIDALARDHAKWLKPVRGYFPPFVDFCKAVESLWDDKSNNVRGDLGGYAVIGSPPILELQRIARKAWGRRFYRQALGELR